MRSKGQKKAQIIMRVIMLFAFVGLFCGGYFGVSKAYAIPHTDIVLSGTSINEKVLGGSTIGTLSTTDVDAGVYTYSLVEGDGSTDNASFYLHGSSLIIIYSPDYETKNSYSVRIRATDAEGVTYEKVFTININDLNEKPTDIALSSTSINENVAVNTVVGTLSTTDPDAGNTFTYTFVAGTGDSDNASFNISGSSLRITSSPDYETKSSYSIRIRGTDQGGLYYEKAFTIYVNVSEYTLTYIAGAGGTITGTATQTVNSGANGTAVTATPNSGYHFVGWSDGATTATRTDVNINANITVTATFAMTPTISIGNATVVEGDSGTRAVEFTVVLSPESEVAISVNYATSNGTAIAGTDYIAASGVITFARGETSKTITIAVNGDLIDEENEGFYVSLSGATSGVDISDAFGIGTITDNDPMPTLSIGDATVEEGDSGTSAIEFTVELSAESGKIISVIYSTSNGTAIVGIDYIADFRVITFTPGETSKTITINVIGDTLDEDNEYFEGNLSGASNATISDSSARGTITDDDPAPAISIGDATVTEGDTGTVILIYTVTLSGASGKTVTVDCATQDGTATTADNDYEAKTTTLTFAPGETSKTITVTVNGDNVLEDDETVLVKLSNPTNTTITAGQDTGTGTITNDEYTLTYTAGTGGTITGTATQIVSSGANGTAVTATPNSGYYFVGWSDGVATATRTDSNVTGNIAVTATFAINEYTLAYTAGANGTITGTATQTVSSGANGTAVTATPNSGYYFVGWSDGVATATRTDSNVTGNIAVTATFAINEYTLTYTAGTGGTITGTATQTVNSGANGTVVTATPNSGYHFVGWSDGVTTATRTDNNVTGNITVTATFAITSSPSPTTPTTSTQSSTKEIRQVSVNGVSEESAKAVTTVDIVREITNDKKIDTVTLTRAKTEEVFQKVLDQNQDKIQIAVDEPENDKADEIEFVIDKDAIKKLADSEVALDVKTEAVSIEIPKESVQGISENKTDIYFRVLPIRNEVEKTTTIQNAITAGVVQTASGNSEAVALGIPMMIESNYQGHKTMLVFSLKNISMPEDETQRALFLSGLGVYINHSDGEQEFNRGRIIYDSNGYPVGIEIEISKFSTFTLLSMKNEAPIASDLVINGKSEYGKKLTASYTYNDKEQNEEGKSLFYWYRADNKKGKNKKQVAKGTLNYKIVKADQGKYLILEITPLATSGESTGSTVSAYVKVAENKAPKAVSKKISGKTVVGSKLSLKYIYQDAESDKEGKTTIQWYRADSASGANKKKIKNANKLTYTLTKADQGKYIIAEITPVAKTGSKVGTKTTFAANTVITKAKDLK